MKVSIVVLTYNQEKYIRNTLDSLLNQDCDISYEILVSDDCSSDSTPSIIRQYSILHPNVVKPIFHIKNIGSLNNYYSTLLQCTGEYIMICDGDDYWLPGKLFNQVQYMDNNPGTVLYHSRTAIVDENNQNISKSVMCPQQLSFQQLVTSNPICACSACFRRNLAFDYIKSVDPEVRDWKMADYPMWLYLSQRGKIEYTPKILCAYRIIPGSVSHPQSLDKQVSFEISTYEIKRFFIGNNKKLQRLALLSHCNNLACIYKLCGDLDNFRYYSRKSGTLRGFVKSIVPSVFYSLMDSRQ